MTDSVDELALAMLTLRVDNATGWLKPEDETVFHELWREAEALDAEGLVLSLMNLGWYALINLSAQTDKTPSDWLATIAADLREDE